MKPSALFWSGLFCFALSLSAVGEAPQQLPNAAPAPQTAQPAAGAPSAGQGAAAAAPNVLKDESTLNLDSEEAYIDRWDALKSKQYVHRVVLSAAVQSSSRVTTGRPYVNHVMGFSNIWQDEVIGKTTYDKYVTGVQGISGGYVFSKGHAVEVGLEVSGVSNAYLGYRYFFRNPRLSIWPFLGAGAGAEIESLSIKDSPTTGATYGGSRTMGYFTLGLVIPLVDVGLRAEARFNFYGTERLVLTQGLGATIFF